MSDFVTMVEEVHLFKNDLSPAVLQAISEAAAWCSHRAFHSSELDPVAILEIPDFSHSSESIETYIERKRDCYRRATSWINQTRSQILKEGSIETLDIASALSMSKLLIYEPLETVSDGAAEAASGGFYDVKDAPPWDTWFLYSNGAVFCCVPDSAISRAQDGIDANPVDCIRWAKWSQLAHI